MLGLSERQVRVIAPFIGGGFGPKIMMFYQEEVLVPWAAMKLNRPVKWIEDRAENFVATTHERGQIHDAEIAFDKDGHILGVHDVFLMTQGVCSLWLTVRSTVHARYLDPTISKITIVNSRRSSPTRPSSRPIAARDVSMACSSSSAHWILPQRNKIDRAEIRRRNFIPPDKFPYNNEIIYQDFAPLVYDSGNYEPLLDQAMEKIGYHKFIKGLNRSCAEGKHVGIGVVAYGRHQALDRIRSRRCR
jgi:CO/xanthine dehydrogenase Mo-binding subunit